jgi:hypothetical protein
MGLFKHLLFWPVTGPMFLTRFALDKVHGAVRQELTDDTPLKEELLQLQFMLELGDIDEEEYERREAEIMERLREVRRWREELGMASPGGPVRVAGSGSVHRESAGEPPSPPGERPQPSGEESLRPPGSGEVDWSGTSSDDSTSPSSSS